MCREREGERGERGGREGGERGRESEVVHSSYSC